MAKDSAPLHQRGVFDRTRSHDRVTPHRPRVQSTCGAQDRLLSASVQRESCACYRVLRQGFLPSEGAGAGLTGPCGRTRACTELACSH